MPTPSPLHELVGRRFVAAFGEPTYTQGRDWHWALSPVAHVSPINVLVNGSPECPVVSIFDPHPPLGVGVSVPVRTEAEADAIIAAIAGRVNTVPIPADRVLRTTAEARELAAQARAVRAAARAARDAKRRRPDSD
jgi:hypothetical protein